MIETVSEWTRHANLRFKVVRSGDAELRVDFGDAGSWSYLGKDSLATPKDEATINLGAMTGKTPDSVLRPVVLHEFGHALGMKGHSDDKKDIMYFQMQEKRRQIPVPIIPMPLFWKSLVKNPSPRDLNTLIRLYNTAGYIAPLH